MNISAAAITAETILKDIHTLEEAKDFARGMRETAIVVGNAHGEESAIYRSVYDRYWDFVDEMALKITRRANAPFHFYPEQPMPQPDYFMGFARHAATASKDSTQVGAALVDRDGTVLLTSYNGPPRGVRDLPERFVRPVKYAFASHAERNLVAFAARKGIATDGCSMYVTHAACGECMKSIIQAGITCVYVGDGVTVMDIEPESAIMADEAGVKVVRI